MTEILNLDDNNCLILIAKGKLNAKDWEHSNGPVILEMQDGKEIRKFRMIIVVVSQEVGDLVSKCLCSGSYTRVSRLGGCPKFLHAQQSVANRNARRTLPALTRLALLSVFLATLYSVPL